MVNYVVRILAVPEFMPELTENSQNIQFCEFFIILFPL